MSTSSARPDDLDAFVGGSRAADDELRTEDGRTRAAYADFQAGNRWGSLDASSLIAAFGRYIELNEADAKWVAQIAAAFRAAGGDGGPTRLPDAAIEASLRAAGLTGGRASVTFDSPVAYGFPATTGYADDPVNTASGNFLLAETDLPGVLPLRRTYNSRSDVAGAFGPGWSSWTDARLTARADGAHYTGPDGQRAVFPREGEAYGRVIGIGGRVTAGSPGLVLRWFDGRVWEFDEAGRPARIDGSITCGYEDGRLTTLTRAGGRALRFEWAGGRVVAVTASDGRQVGYTYRDGHLVAAGERRYTVDERIVAVLDADGVAEATNTYDADGRVLTQVSRFGQLTRFLYLPGHVTVTAGDEEDSPATTYVHDDAGRLLSVTDGHGQRLSRTYDAWGNPVLLTDRNGAIEVTEWDEQCRPVRRVLHGGAAFGYAYDDAGRPVTVTASTGAATTFRYDGAERTPSEVIDAEGGITRLDVRDGVIRRITDPDGVVLTLQHDADGSVTATTDALGNTARLERDATGRVVAAITPTGRRTTFAYDAYGWPSARRGPDGTTWRWEHTAAGRRTAVVDPTGARHEIRYGAHGGIEATIGPLGDTDLRQYDRLGNVVRVLASDGAKWDHSYDALSRLVSTTDPAGATWLREYDVAGHLVGTVDPVGTHYTATVDLAGRVTRVDDGVTSAAFEYDPLGRAVAQIRPDGTKTRAAYDRCGRRTTVEDPSGGVTRIEYTPAGRVLREVSPGG
ncbi:DUF6531 domain-containing protein [Actinoplanes sp. RD1]|uniref:DUF6531 domain-containing protein n=1 Tax=Actinoplanes sp. RD1 TaxID=3064538 RepID=UPI00274052C8|nr:DUF6531 domain-containing protein [Actinoplanes sp. RD1]